MQIEYTTEQHGKREQKERMNGRKKGRKEERKKERKKERKNMADTQGNVSGRHKAKTVENVNGLSLSHCIWKNSDSWILFFFAVLCL